MITFKKMMRRPFTSYVTEQKVYYKASNRTRRGVASAFTADEVSKGKIVLSARNTENGSSDKIGYYTSIEEATVAANEIAVERNYEFVV